MPIPPLVLLAGAFFVATAVLAWMVWRAGKHSLRIGLQERTTAKESGSFKPRLEHPWIDLSRCIGCASCVRACPEQGVLDILHGQAAVVHGSRCIGHGECAAHCPVGAIALTMADRGEREDLPALLPDMEAVGQPGLYLAGEVTGYALIRTAVDHGTRAARGAHQRKLQAAPLSLFHQEDSSDKPYDLVIVGAGPAGLAAALEAKRLGLRFLVLEQDRIGGTIARYPRRKLINTHEIQLPLGGVIEGRTYQKQELMELWTKLCFEHELPVQENQIFEGVTCDVLGIFTVKTKSQSLQAYSVCLALGRRGIPTKLGVPGEDLMKVNYSLIDAHAYRGMQFLIVGGGDSAIEAALGLAEQPGNQVHISYRRNAFFRLRARNQLQIQEAVRDQKIRVHFETTVHQIEMDRVLLRRADENAPLLAIPNNEVFILVGGDPPIPLLKEAGVSFDPNLGPTQETLREQGVGLLLPLLIAAGAAGALLLWGTWQAGYYQVDPFSRIVHESHSWLRPASGLGLFAGILAVCLIATNLLYLVRRNRKLPMELGSLGKWMSVHIGTGMLSLILAILHSGFSLSNTLGGHSLLGLSLLVGTGALGRYFYSFVPRAANGREHALDEALQSLHLDAQAWTEVHRGFGETSRREIAALIDRTRWQHGAIGSIMGLLRAQSDLRRTLKMLSREGQVLEVDEISLNKVLRVARRAHRDALIAGHYEDLRALLASWRYLHRWAGLMVVILLVAHIWYSWLYADLGSAG